MCIFRINHLHFTGGIFMNNQWAAYGPQPGMAYVNQPQQNGCYMVPTSQEEENNKIIRQTALCCTVAVLIGVGVGMMIQNNVDRRTEAQQLCNDLFD